MAKKRCFLPLYLLWNQADGELLFLATVASAELFDTGDVEKRNELP
jgi:hypothetical protein